jgi:polar amino acid transport system permease protein
MSQKILSILTDITHREKRNYILSVIAFFLLIAGMIGALYVATAQIDYVWRWFSVPQYFIFQDNISISSDIEGDVDKITITGNKAEITIKGVGETETYTVPADAVLVYEGDMISPGDALGEYKEWKAGILLQGLWLTLKVSFMAIFFGIIIGLFGGLARISSNPAIKWSMITYIELIRGSPLLVQIFIWYFVLGTLINNLLAKNGLGQIPPLWFGVAALACFSGAYVAEIVRAGIQSIHRGQSEASRSLGMTYFQSMSHVILPQALRRIIPPLAGQFISLIKDSSLLGIGNYRHKGAYKGDTGSGYHQPSAV